MSCHRCEIEKDGRGIFCSACGAIINKPNFKVKFMESYSTSDGSKFEKPISQAHVNDIRSRRVVKTEAQKESANMALKQEKKAKAENERIKIYVP